MCIITHNHCCYRVTPHTDTDGMGYDDPMDPMGYCHNTDGVLAWVKDGGLRTYEDVKGNRGLEFLPNNLQNLWVSNA